MSARQYAAAASDFSPAELEPERPRYGDVSSAQRDLAYLQLRQKTKSLSPPNSPTVCSEKPPYNAAAEMAGMNSDAAIQQFRTATQPVFDNWRSLTSVERHLKLCEVLNRVLESLGVYRCKVALGSFAMRPGADFSIADWKITVNPRTVTGTGGWHRQPLRDANTPVAQRDIINIYLHEGQHAFQAHQAGGLLAGKLLCQGMTLPPIVQQIATELVVPHEVAAHMARYPIHGSSAQAARAEKAYAHYSIHGQDHRRAEEIKTESLAADDALDEAKLAVKRGKMGAAALKPLQARADAAYTNYANQFVEQDARSRLELKGGHQYYRGRDEILTAMGVPNAADPNTQTAINKSVVAPTQVMQK